MGIWTYSLFYALKRGASSQVMDISLDHAVRAYRLASRDLYNNYFYNSYFDPYLLRETYSELQDLMFQKMVEEPFSLKHTGYGDVHRDIWVRNRFDADIPAMINREIDSGYWDYPIKLVSPDAVMFFISFFDLDETRGMENLYVLLEINEWSQHKEADGKRALVEYQYVCFEAAEE